MRNYELVVVLDGKTTAAKKKTATEKLEKLVKSVKGEVKKVKDLGVKDLAYKIRKSVSGVFLLMDLEIDGAGAKEIGGKLRLQDDVIRYLLIKKDK